MANIVWQNGIGLAVGAGERQRFQVAAIGQRVLLGDHAAHRDAHQVEAGEAERVDQRLGVVGEQLRGVGTGRLVGLADAAIVEAQHAVAGLDERRDLEAPGHQVVGEAVDQDDGLLGGSPSPSIW